jgi:predicted Zn-dependent peptidase
MAQAGATSGGAEAGSGLSLPRSLRRNGWWRATLLAAALALAPAAGLADEPLTRGISRFHLPNGLDLVVAVRPELELAAVNLTVDLGSIDDPLDQAGMAHLLEHVTLQGSVAIGSLDPAAEAAAVAELDRAAADLASEQQKLAPQPQTVAGLEQRLALAEAAARRTAETGEIIGGRLERRGAIGTNATTTADATQFFSWIPPQDFELWISLEADRLRHPIFRRFYSEREVVLREIDGLTGGRRTPQELFLAELFPGGPESRPLAGDPVKIRTIDRPAALAYFSRRYRPEAMAVAVVGKVDPERIHQLCLRYLGDWRPEGSPLPHPPQTPAPAASRVRTFNSTRNPLVFLGFPQPDSQAAGTPAFDALAELINAEDLSPVFARLVQERALAWSVGAAAHYPSEKQTSVFLVHVYGNPGVRHEDLTQEVSGLLKGLARASDDEVEGAILKAEMRLATQLDDPPTLASLLALHQAVHGDWSVPFQRLDGLRRLTPEEVRAAAGRLFGASPPAAVPAAGSEKR